ncbi:MAG: hypothetical protein KA186_09515 [Flavobacteriales bacterium]|nr:hypothetical protein [Flavobacteriales bacterium]
MRNVWFLCLVGCVLTKSISAQQPFPTAADEPRWSVSWYILGPFAFNNAFSCSTSIDLCGHTYSAVEEFNPIGPAYFRNDGQRTLLRRTTNCTDKEYLLYDFSLNAGETTYVGSETFALPDTAMAIVQSIDTIEVLGTPRRRFTMLIDLCPSEGNEPFFTPMEWIEGIGSTTHPFYAAICLCDGCESSINLQCSDSSGRATYRVPPDIICDFTSGFDEHDSAAGEFQVRATGDNLRLIYPTEFQAGLLTILDPAGRVAFSKQVSATRTSIDLPALAPGPYTALIQNRDQQWATRWVLMR